MIETYTLGFGSEDFLKEEEDDSKVFRCKPKIHIKKIQVSFNGIMLSDPKTKTLSISHTDKINCLELVNTEKGFSSQRAAAKYIGVNIRTH